MSKMPDLFLKDPPYVNLSCHIIDLLKTIATKNAKAFPHKWLEVIIRLHSELGGKVVLMMQFL